MRFFLRTLLAGLMAASGVSVTTSPAFAVDDDASAAAQGKADAARQVQVASSAGRIPLRAQELRTTNVNAHALSSSSDIIDHTRLLAEVFSESARRRDALQKLEPSEKQRLKTAKRKYIDTRKQAQNARRDAHRAVDAWGKGEKERIKRLRDSKPSKDAEQQLNAWVKSEHERLRHMKERKPGRDREGDLNAWVKAEHERLRQMKDRRPGKDLERDVNNWANGEKSRLRQLKDRKPGKDMERDVNNWAKGEKNRIKNIRDKGQRQNAERGFKDEERNRRDAAKHADKNAHDEWQQAEDAFKGEERNRREAAKNADKNAHEEWQRAESTFKNEERTRRDGLKNADRGSHDEWQRAEKAFKDEERTRRDAFKRSEREGNDRVKTEWQRADADFKREERARRRSADQAERDVNNRAKTEWQEAQASYKDFLEELKNARFEAKSMPRYEKQLRPELLVALKQLNNELKGVTNEAGDAGARTVSISVIANLRPDIVLGYLKGIVSDKVRPSVLGGIERSLQKVFVILDRVVSIAIKIVVAAVGSIPFVGGALAAVAAAAGSAIYNAVKGTVMNSVRKLGRRINTRLITSMGERLLAAVSKADAKTEAIVAAARAAAAESNQHLDKASAQYEQHATAARAEKFSLEGDSAAAAKKLAAEAKAEHQAMAKGELQATGAAN